MMTQSSTGGLGVFPIDFLMGPFTHDDTVKHWWTGCFLDGTIHS